MISFPPLDRRCRLRRRPSPVDSRMLMGITTEDEKEDVEEGEDKAAPLEAVPAPGTKPEVKADRGRRRHRRHEADSPFLSMRGLIKGSSPYVSLDETRLAALSPIVSLKKICCSRLTRMNILSSHHHVLLDSITYTVRTTR
jgi:hypothetical protein